MRKQIAEQIVQDPERFAHHDRIFLNNPVVMQGMGLAPLVVVATTGQNALMLAAAVALLLTPSRLLACLVSKIVPLEEYPEPEQLEKRLLPRAILYCLSTSVVYLGAYWVLNRFFGTGLLSLGIYLPLLVAEPLMIYRFGRVQEPAHKALSKGVRITIGYALLLVVVGCLREWLAAGTMFGLAVSRPVLPVAGIPAGGFIVLGVLCAVWRAAADKRRAYLEKEAQDVLAVHGQKEEREQ